MRLQLHPDISIQRLTIGAEAAPLLVIDELVAAADDLVGAAASMKFSASTRHYPGIRAAAPLEYQELLATRLGALLASHFRIEATSVRFTMCHFSLITTPADALAPIQRIPHIDSLGRDGLATIHYLFHRDLGGTAFYRHRSTGFEFVDEDRSAQYFEALEREQATLPASGYINGDTHQFEKVTEQRGVFNRMLVYRRNSLHSGCIPPDFTPDANPCTGRLSINSFIDFRR
jgi:uncharacterized protein DUF6445